jgi:hypothetical protein
MQIPREQVLEFVTDGMGDGIRSAQDELPAYVDTERDAGLLNRLGIDPNALLGQFNGRGLEA